MKPGIHPDYAPAKITCACGRVTETFSTVGEIHVEICSHCHPFFTGKQKLVDTAGRVERFKAKYGSATPRQKTARAPEPEAAETAKAAAEASAAETEVPTVEPAASEPGASAEAPEVPEETEEESPAADS